ncbi:putative tail structural protein [Pelagibacter phage HTVC100P]|nr:putative tail structural protein [Pelagibacter phage HTVC100P]
MAYIGRDTDKISNVEVLDNITFNGSSSYTLQKGGSNFTPSSANTLLLSIDGVVQAGNFTVSGSTIDFGTAVAGTSTCDFILHYGVGLITIPADGSVTAAKLASGVGGVAGITSNADATAITIDSSENVGIGETSPSSLLHLKNATPNLIIQDTGTAGTDATPTITFKDTSSTQGTINFNNGGDMEIIQSKANALKFKTSDTERMRIASDGVVGIGTSSPNSNYRLSVVAGSGAIVGAFIETTSTNSGHEASIIKRPNSGVLVQFLGSGQVGSITTNGSTTTYGTSSDYRLKENIVEITDATARLKQLKPKRFNFIADADTTVDGFIAHEVQDVVPEAIYGEKDAMKTEEYEVTPAVLDEDGNVITEAVMGTREVPDYQGIDQSKLVPLLVKTIQELEARITQLENA